MRPGTLGQIIPSGLHWAASALDLKVSLWQAILSDRMAKFRKRTSRKKRIGRRWINPLALDRMFDHIVQRGDIEGPAIVYHYTPWVAAHGIIASQRFWATAHDCTNDEAELVTADSIIKDVAIGLRQKAVGTAAAVLDSFITGYPQLHITRMITVCLSCFSAARDDPEQWKKPPPRNLWVSRESSE